MNVRYDSGELFVGSLSIDFHNIILSIYGSTENRIAAIGTSFWWKCTYNKFDCVTTYTNSTGFWWNRDYDNSGKLLAFLDSKGNRYTY